MNTADSIGNELISPENDSSKIVDVARLETSQTEGNPNIDATIPQDNGVVGTSSEQDKNLKSEFSVKPPLASRQCTHNGDALGSGPPAEVIGSLHSETIAIKSEIEEMEMGVNYSPSLTAVPIIQATERTDGEVAENNARDVPEELRVAEEGNPEEEDGVEEEDAGGGGVRDEEMREAETDSDPYVSESSESSSESESEAEPLDEVIAKVMQSKGGGAGSDDEDATGPPRTKNEVKVLPPVPPVDVELRPNQEISVLGQVTAIMGASVVVQASPAVRALNEGSILWHQESRKPLGRVDEVFGPVRMPFYLVRYNRAEDIQSDVVVGTPVAYADEHVTFVLNDASLNQKGYDKSGADDEEVSEEEAEFSDDEKEAEYKRAKKQSKRKDAAGEGPSPQSSADGGMGRGRGRGGRGRNPHSGRPLSRFGEEQRGAAPRPDNRPDHSQGPHWMGQGGPPHHNSPQAVLLQGGPQFQYAYVYPGPSQGPSPGPVGLPPGAVSVPHQYHQFGAQAGPGGGGGGAAPYPQVGHPGVENWSQQQGGWPPQPMGGSGQFGGPAPPPHYAFSAPPRGGGYGPPMQGPPPYPPRYQ